MYVYAEDEVRIGIWLIILKIGHYSYYAYVDIIGLPIENV